jgi:predicted adenylyl cyclase CyaB
MAEVLNLEIKARCADAERVRSVLRAANARFAGTDHQTDTYFHVASGRLKLRQGNIENALIFYRRPDHDGPKASEVTMHSDPGIGALKPVLEAALGVRAVVRKKREIYYVGNIKFHIDEVDGLGWFVEIEAAGAPGGDRARLQAQCENFMSKFGIAAEDLLTRSYSDMVATR